MSAIWEAYQKFLDRRLTRYGPDSTGYLDEALRDATEASFFDFTSAPVEIEEEAGAGSFPRQTWASRPSIHGEGILVHPDLFFLPFPTCAAEFRVPANPEGGRPEGTVLVLTSRPEGHEVGFGHGEVEWPVMIATRDPSTLGVLRITKLVLCGTSSVSGREAVDALLFSCCDYTVATGKCVQAHRHDQIERLPGSEGELARKTWSAISRAATQYAVWGMARMEEANSPANWVVRVTDEHARVVKRRGKKAKQKRTRLIVVPDRDLDRVLRLPNEGGDYIDRAPHRRRAHYRRLTSPRFRLKQGQRVWVRESWVGPKEATHGGEHYEVLTSLPSHGGDPATTTKED